MKVVLSWFSVGNAGNLCTKVHVLSSVQTDSPIVSQNFQVQEYTVHTHIKGPTPSCKFVCMNNTFTHSQLTASHRFP